MYGEVIGGSGFRSPRQGRGLGCCNRVLLHVVVYQTTQYSPLFNILNRW